MAIQHEKLYQALAFLKNQKLNPVLGQLFPEKHRRHQQRNKAATKTAAAVTTATREERNEDVGMAPVPAITIGSSPVSEPSGSAWLLPSTSQDPGEPEVYLDICRDDDEEEEEGEGGYERGGGDQGPDVAEESSGSNSQANWTHWMLF